MTNVDALPVFSPHGTASCTFKLFLLTAASLAVGCSGGKASSRLSLETPQATLQTVKQAVVGEDFTTFAECLTDDALNEMAGTFRMMGEMFKMMAGMTAAMGGEADQAMTKFADDVGALVKKHVPANAAPMPSMMTMSAKSEAEKRTIIRDIGNAVVEQEVFVASVMKSLIEMSRSNPNGFRPNDMEIGEIQIDGDMATATVSSASANGEQRDSQVTLRRVDGQWKIDDLGGLGTTPQSMTMPGGPGSPEF